MAVIPILLPILLHCRIILVLNAYDFPQYCFGGDGLGNYGLNFIVDYLSMAELIYSRQLDSFRLLGLELWYCNHLASKSDNLININQLRILLLLLMEEYGFKDTTDLL